MVSPPNSGWIAVPSWHSTYRVSVQSWWETSLAGQCFANWRSLYRERYHVEGNHITLRSDTNDKRQWYVNVKMISILMWYVGVVCNVNFCLSVLIQLAYCSVDSATFKWKNSVNRKCKRSQDLLINHFHTWYNQSVFSTKSNPLSTIYRNNNSV